jgi:polyferredoxin
MRLDIFLPFLRKAKKSVRPRPDNWVLRLAKRVLPKSLFADKTAGKPGLIRRVLKRIGPTWLSSPLRRVIQSVCFLVFLALFFYVCWPYSAQPSRIWPDWKLQKIDAAGHATLTVQQPLVEPIAVGMTLHAVEQGLAGEEPTYLGSFRVSHISGQRLELVPEGEIPSETLMQLSFSSASWSLYEAQPGSWPSHYADSLARKEKLPAESVLIIDPLVSLSTALASKSWVWSLVFAGVILAIGVLVPRGFCSYICPLGTLIDLFDWLIGKRVTRLRVADDGWWVHIKYYLLLGTLVAAMFGVLVSGYVAAIPVITRGLLFLVAPLQTGAMRGWHQVPPMNAGHFVSIGLFFAVLGMGLFKPRFWCKYVCPSGAVFSVGNLLRVSERKVESTCINCNKCVEICPFDAIKPDFTTRTSDCTLCQTCGGVCPTQAIKFVERWNRVELKVLNDPPTHETAIGRRGFLSLAAGTAAAAVGGVGLTVATKTFGANLDDPNAPRPVRPPGSVPEKQFLELCIRCGECFRACPNDVLQPLGFQQGLEGLWTPAVAADWAGCESSCNACGQVCPTGAIRALPLEEKKVVRMGLAIVNEKTCLPFAGREACQLCVDECVAAGYHAIEFTRVGTQVDDWGLPVEGTGYLAPVVLADKCVGCGLCQTRCYGINAAEKGLLKQSAIIIEAGEGQEDRLMSGSYIALRQAEQKRRQAEQQQRSEQTTGGDSYLPDFID